ncbi:hypothetical protein EV356DRAFT_73449 [Viridothelium virens]|uniref:Uncharacterized protein n=1 Tax=Viridothelium virens TaxID=1048519 RepID=A0A6A6HGA2_VIRVR|nr:hypothetical protein EV356DRAFT_73449 [Viridothelium virens]
MISNLASRSSPYKTESNSREQAASLLPPHRGHILDILPLPIKFLLGDINAYKPANSSCHQICRATESSSRPLRFAMIDSPEQILLGQRTQHAPSPGQTSIGVTSITVQLRLAQGLPSLSHSDYQIAQLMPPHTSQQLDRHKARTQCLKVRTSMSQC